MTPSPQSGSACARTFWFLQEFDKLIAGNVEADVSAPAVGERLGWNPSDASRIAEDLADRGWVEFVEMGSDLVTMTTAVN